MLKNSKGFTLIELLVVMGILGILVSLVAGNFRSSQIRGRDAQRKSDLKQLSTAFELFCQDYGYYPLSEDGFIMACYYEEGVGGNKCTWGNDEDEFKDVYPGTVSTRTIYLKRIPGDPSSSYSYYYRPFDSVTSPQKYQIFAHLENTEDQDCMGGDCVNSPVSYECGSGICNFAVTSTNASYSE